MTDRELLELAAKAAGIDLSGRIYMENCTGAWFVSRTPHEKNWNPLIDSADAFELMVKLEIHAGIGYRRIDACAVGERDGSVFRATESKTGDTAAAMRRAITRCAAAIQEAKEGV